MNADDDVHGQELWVSDGTEEGTYMVIDLVPGPDGSVKVKSYRYVDGLSVSRYNRFSCLPVGFEVMGWA
ncbi:MAG: hypothetical protein IID35_06040 [Planctomycetes bacterium]|nr:hypothetical protein [Planctomycetota bacterium]